MDSMLQEDKDMMDRMKSKWQSAADSQQPTQHAIQEISGEGGDSLANTRICQVCQGSGMQTEVYEFRRMEHTCTHCHGEGLLCLGGRPAKKASSSSTAMIHNSKQPQQQGKSSNSSKQSKQHHSSNKHRLDNLQRKIDELSQEQADLKAAVDKKDSSSKQQSLERQLLQQLQSHLTQLQQQQKRRLTASQD